MTELDDDEEVTMNLGATTIPLAGWLADPGQPKKSQGERLQAIGGLIETYGLRAVELSLDLAFLHPTVFTPEFYQRVGDLQQELGFVCTAHLPMLWVDPVSLNEPIRQTTLDAMRHAVNLLQPIQITSYVIHLWGFTTLFIGKVLEEGAQRQAIFKAAIAQADKSLAEMKKFITPDQLCVENLQAPAFEFIIPLIERHGVSICFDVAHWYAQGGEPLDFLTRYYDHIREVHLHDAARGTDGENRPPRVHVALGQGEVDYKAVLDKLKELDFTGPVIIENNTKVDLETSLTDLK